MSYTLSGDWLPTGFRPDNLKLWHEARKVMLGKRVTVTLELRHATRSDAANRRYWGRIVRGVMGWYNAQPEYRDLPLSKEQVHYVLKLAFLAGREVDGMVIPKDSHDLASDKFSEYCDEIEGHYSALGVEWPNDY